MSGPAAGLAVIVFGYVEQFGFAAFAALVVAAGILQVRYRSSPPSWSRSV